jgi:PTH1 family peptidyl-tRNA hydrolase
MNLSGYPLKKLAEKHDVPIANIVVAHDDLERLPGQCRIKVGGSAAGHNGLKSIITLMGD